MMTVDKPLVVVVTGFSGAGLSTAIKALEDSGFYCVDNLPIELIDSAVSWAESGKRSSKGFAFGMDIRDASISSQFESLKSRLEKRVRLDVVFLKAENDVISTRFSTTRRRHPLLKSGATLDQAIALERELLEPVEQSADAVFDTSDWSPHHLARMFEQRYMDEIEGRQLHVSFVSFGFKNGLLRPLDLLFDVRFLQNPYFVPRMREKTGLDQEVADFIWKDPRSVELFQRLESLHRYLLPQYYAEGKQYLRIGIGCTGGQHRSVFFAEKLMREFQKRPLKHIVVTVRHRDLLELERGIGPRRPL